MRIRDRVRQLEEENRALSDRLAARMKVDKTYLVTFPDALDAVCRNIYHLNPTSQERVLLAAAVVYGIIVPGPKRIAPPLKEPKKS